MHPMDKIAAELDKRFRIVDAITGVAFSLVELFATKAQGLELLTKRAFPDRKKPHRVKRRIKEDASRELSRRGALASLAMGMAAANMHTMAIAPVPSENLKTGTTPQTQYDDTSSILRSRIAVSLRDPATALAQATTQADSPSRSENGDTGANNR